jgi:hypothetical protein
MTVAQLIDILKTLPQDAIVCRYGGTPGDELWEADDVEVEYRRYNAERFGGIHSEHYEFDRNLSPAPATIITLD